MLSLYLKIVKINNPMYKPSPAFVFLLIPLLSVLILGNNASRFEPEECESVAPPAVNFKWQVCNGSLGENIFTDGDFGSGVANNLPNNPNIAPGYGYASAGPPQDGLYILTNNTGNWSGLFPSWIRIQDNSPDPNGYMMVVNASFSPGLFYNKVISDLCENTLYEFSADIINLIRTNTPDHIFPNVTFLINDEVAFTTGNIPQNERWNTYGFTFTTEPGTTMLTLSIRNNAPGGIGNDLALDNITFRACGPEADITPVGPHFVCLDDNEVTISANIFNSPYGEDVVQWESSPDGGISWTAIPGATNSSHTIQNFASGTYLYRYQLAGSVANLNNEKCRVLSKVSTIIVVPIEYTIKDTICTGLTFQVGDHLYTQTGIYRDSLISSLGCDSVVNLDLTVIPDPMINAEVGITPPVCVGDTVGRITILNVQNGTPTFSFQLDENETQFENVFEQLASGTYILTITDRYGCSTEQTVNIPSPVPLVLTLGEDQSISLGQSVQLTPSSNYPNLSYNWQPADLFDCLDCSKNNIRPFESTQVLLEVTNADGCVAQDSLYIMVDKSYPLYAPNVFSPNDDGINDYFTIFADPEATISIRQLLVFDRWGNLLFEKQNLPLNNEAEGWNGYLGNKLAESGLYVYFADVEFIDGAIRRKKGSVALIK